MGPQQPTAQHGHRSRSVSCTS